MGPLAEWDGTRRTRARGRVGSARDLQGDRQSDIQSIHSRKIQSVGSLTSRDETSGSTVRIHTGMHIWHWHTVIYYALRSWPWMLFTRRGNKNIGAPTYIHTSYHHFSASPSSIRMQLDTCAWPEKKKYMQAEAAPCYADTCASRTPCPLRSHASGSRRISPAESVGSEQVLLFLSLCFLPFPSPHWPWSRHPQ